MELDSWRKLMYRIGEFSKIIKLTVKTLRFYDETGLLKPSFVDKFTGYRYYEMEQLFTAQQIIALRQADFSIDEIRHILSGKDVSDMLEIKESELKREKAEAEEKLNRFSAIKKFYSEEQTMNYQAILKQMPEHIVYYKRFKVHDFSEYGTVIPAIGAEIVAANPDLKCAEPNFCYVEYLEGEYKENDFNVEYAEAVDKIGKETETIKFKILPAALVACVMHKGSYEGLRKGYIYLMNWLKENGYLPAGNAREQYIDGCWNKESEDEYITEIQIPVIKA